MNSKIDHVCSYCSKILQSPIILSCFHTICERHLTEANVLKDKSIRCMVQECQQTFELAANEFGSNVALKSFYENEFYLSKEEKSLKNSLENDLKKVFELNKSFEENKKDFHSKSERHFQDIRIQIKFFYEQAIKNIQKCYSYMKEKVENAEKSCLSRIKIPYMESHETKLMNLNEKFRDPNLTIDSINEMKQKQQLKIKAIQSEIDKLNQLKDSLKDSFKFKPNLNFTKDSFGTFECLNTLLQSQKSNEVVLSVSGESIVPPKIEIKSENSKEIACSSNQKEIPNKKARASAPNDAIYFESKILTNGLWKEIELIRLCEFSLTDKWKLIYRASLDGFGARDFHSKCDGKSPSLIVFKVKNSEFLFGAYTEAAWESNPNGLWKADPKAFIFSLRNVENKPCKLKTNSFEKSIYCHSEWGPTFGHFDIKININSTENNTSDLGNIYKHPRFTKGSIQAQTFLSGSQNFKLSELEVFIKE
jgi:hypothetical protein